jgi:hypothetical protein
MTQRELDHAVARATGESLRQVRRLGFNLLLVPRPPGQAPGVIRLRRGPDRYSNRSGRPPAQAA